MLSKKVQYSFLALIKLAREFEHGPILVSQIADSEHIPKKFLETILLELKNSGLLGSKKGKGGGYYLRKPPEEIVLAEVVRHFDGAIALLPCASVNYYEPCCYRKDESTCGLRNVFREVRQETFRILNETTLAKILQFETELVEKSDAFDFLKRSSMSGQNTRQVEMNLVTH